MYEREAVACQHASPVVRRVAMDGVERRRPCGRAIRRSSASTDRLKKRRWQDVLQK